MIQRLVLAGLVSVSLAAAVPCASAQSACQAASRHAGCCDANGAEPSCAPRCVEEPGPTGSVTAITPPASQQLWLLSAAHHLSAETAPMTLVVLRPASLVQSAFHAPPRRYLLACTFRL